MPLELQQLRYERNLVVSGGATKAVGNAEEIRTIFPNTYGLPAIKILRSTTPSAPSHRTPLKIGVVLSGGQAAGGHNVIAGIFDYISHRNPQSQMFGFKGGPIGIIKGDYMKLDAERIDSFRNQGGFDIIGTGRNKIEKPAEFLSSFEHCHNMDLDGLVVIGGDDSNTNAALLGEYFEQQFTSGKSRKRISVVGVPKTIDGDLQSDKGVEVSFGFDSATKVYSSLIGNVATDCNSSRKYYHFIRLMGRSASHITLECALRCRPNIALIGEEIQQKKSTLHDLAMNIADIVAERSRLGKDFGIALIPEGLIEFIPEMRDLISEINEIVAKTPAATQSQVASALSESAQKLFNFLPDYIKEQLLFDRDPHGNVLLSQIETEKLFVHLVSEELEKRSSAGTFNGSFKALTHFFGYEGRCVMPSNFDSNYCYSLGRVAAVLLEHGKNGYMASLTNLTQPPALWRPVGAPLTSMMNVERRAGKNKPVIRKALVKLDRRGFAAFSKRRAKWALQELYINPGPIQYSGPTSDSVPVTLQLERGSPAKNYRAAL